MAALDVGPSPSRESPLAVVFARGSPAHLGVGRTVRALVARGVHCVDGSRSTLEQLAEAVDGRAVWLVRAGAVPVASIALETPPSSATGRPLLALGAIRAHPAWSGREVPAWTHLLRRTGGDLSRRGRAPFPPLASVYADATASRDLARFLREGAPLSVALTAAASARTARVVRHAPLDVHDDECLRVMLAVTSLQRGGAERMVLHLFQELRSHGVVALLATVGRASRATFDVPEGTLNLTGLRDRGSALARAAIERGVDLVHGNLLHDGDVRQLAESLVPLVMTVHNAPSAWPAALHDLEKEHVDLLVACSAAVETDLLAAPLPCPVRVAHNGIDPAPFAPSEALRATGARFRAEHGIGAADRVLVAVANPRAQKRLERLPAVVAAMQKAMTDGRRVFLVIVGETDPTGDDGSRAFAALRQAIAEQAVGHRVVLTGLRDDVAGVLVASDVLVSASAHEGMSLAQLEALAAGLPVVSTEVGGTRELARDHPAMRTLSLSASAEEIAAACIAACAGSPAARRAAPSFFFTRDRMAARYAALYRRAAARRTTGRRAGVVLVTNNFASGGAQSSARRLLLGLSAEGIRARAVVLQESPEFPTPGRSALVARGIPVCALGANSVQFERALDRLLDDLDDDPPEALVFWNALAGFKVHLADAMLDVPVYDVSPGEMYFESLARWFADHGRGSPYRDAASYGAKLAGVVVKYQAEAACAREVLGTTVHVVPNGVDLGPPPAARGGRGLNLATAARISPQKKLEQLIEALRLAAPKLPEHVLTIAGRVEPGHRPYAEALRRAAAGLEVRWLGELLDVRPMLATSDVFAMISEPAGCPNASLEAMAAGLPVIATDFGGASEQVIDGHNGRLIARGDVAGFASALVELGRDPVLRRAMGAAARSHAEERFDARRMVSEYRRILLGS